MKKRIAIVTAARAEYGILTPLIRGVQEDRSLELMLMVTGGHLSEKQGFTLSAILEDGFPVSCEIPILEENNDPCGISFTMANALRGFAGHFREDRPDLLVILGDRTEMLAVAAAAMNERIPIAHIHGGEVTQGAVDDCVRHALTKMSFLHFTSAEEYRRRVIQLGEAPERVYNVGSLGVENILKAPLLPKAHIREELGIDGDIPYAVVTFHPVTLEGNTETEQVLELCGAMEKKSGLFYLITRANADCGGDAVNHILERFSRGRNNAKMVDSLGMVRYLSAVKYASFVLGNSSSGILEAPVLGVPTVNIGDRQKGRLRTETIIDCPPEQEAIAAAMDRAEQMDSEVCDRYGDGSTSQKIIEIIKQHFDWGMDLKKGFYDIY